MLSPGLRIAVGTPIAERPRTDPYVPNSGIRFLPPVVDGEASVEVGLDTRPLLPSRTPSGPCDALSRLGVQSVAPGFAFPSVPPPLAPPAPPPVARLCSSASQLLSPSVTSHVRHRRLRLLTSGECVAFVRLHGPARRRSRPARRETSRFPRYKELTHVPGSSTTPDRCSRYRASLVLPSAVSTASASGRSNFRGSNGWPLRTPAGASDLPSRTSTHGSGSDVVR